MSVHDFPRSFNLNVIDNAYISKMTRRTLSGLMFNGIFKNVEHCAVLHKAKLLANA